MSPEEDRTRDTVDSEPKHYQQIWSYAHVSKQFSKEVMNNHKQIHQLFVGPEWKME